MNVTTIGEFNLRTSRRIRKAEKKEKSLTQSRKDAKIVLECRTEQRHRKTIRFRL
jgi:hypothetical protein